MITANTHMTSPDTASGVSSPVKAPKKAAPAFDMNSLFSEENILKIVYSKIIGKNKNVFGLDFVSAASFVRNLRNEIDIIRRKTADGSYSFTRTDPRPEGVSFPLIMRQGEYLVLGDAREDAVDSRDFGAVTRAEILGKVLF